MKGSIIAIMLMFTAAAQADVVCSVTRSPGNLNRTTQPDGGSIPYGSPCGTVQYSSTGTAGATKWYAVRGTQPPALVLAPCTCTDVPASSSSSTSSSSGSGSTSSTSSSSGSTSSTSSSSSGGLTYYLSPTGSDQNDCTSAPCKTFARAFAVMPGGSTLVLEDGNYGTATGTGYMNYQGAGSAQVPSGSAGRETVIRARNEGAAVIVGGSGDNNGPVFVGRSTRKDSYIRFQDLLFRGDVQLYNTDHVTVKNSGVNGSMSIGTNDHSQGNENNLIEDVWVWTTGKRVIAINYRAHHNVWRRVIVRGDGCGKTECQGSGNPNVGFTVYDSHDVSVQNVMLVDRILAAGDEPYSDFAVAQHTEDQQYWLGRDEWLGTISLNSPDVGYYMEPDFGQILDPTITIKNAIAWNSKSVGFNMSRDGRNTSLTNVTSYVSGAGAVGMRVGPELAVTGRGPVTITNVSISGNGQIAFNVSYAPTYVNLFGTWSERYKDNYKPCMVSCFSADPQFTTLTEPGLPLKGKGSNGEDIGANVTLRYGLEGTRFGEAGYNTLSQAALWPWPNQDRIKREMCASVTRGFCSADSLTSYVQNFGR